MPHRVMGEHWMSNSKRTFRPNLSHECVLHNVTRNVKAVENPGALALGLGPLPLHEAALGQDRIEAGHQLVMVTRSCAWWHQRRWTS